jgi:hypothetical protein
MKRRNTSPRQRSLGSPRGAGQNPKSPKQKCRICGCTDENCIQCIVRTGLQCHWVAPNLCSACRIINQTRRMLRTLRKELKRARDRESLLGILQMWNVAFGDFDSMDSALAVWRSIQLQLAATELADPPRRRKGGG